MKLFRRDPANRRPAETAPSGYQPTGSEAFTIHRPSAEQSDETTIATLMSLFREDDEPLSGAEGLDASHAPETAGIEQSAQDEAPEMEMTGGDPADRRAQNWGTTAGALDLERGAAGERVEPFRPAPPTPGDDNSHPVPLVAQTFARARAPADAGAADRLRARRAEASDANWADPALMPRTTPDAARHDAEAPDLSGPLLLRDRAPQDAGAGAITAPRMDLGGAPEAEAAIVDVPIAASARPARRGGRVKTRLLGFEQSHAGADPIARARDEAPAVPAEEARFPVGWIVVLKGPGRGACFTLYSGVSQIGRGEDQTVRLDFGDSSISRQGHAVLAYDPEQRKHFVGHGGKANIVRLNDMPVLSTEELHDGDRIRLGETTLRFVALCGEDFDWDSDEEAAGDEFSAE